MVKILNFQEKIFIKNLSKAYTEGIYSDTPANRKLGRVGMSYAAYATKMKGKEGKKEDKNIQDSPQSISNKETTKIINKIENFDKNVLFAKQNCNIKTDEEALNILDEARQKLSSKRWRGGALTIKLGNNNLTFFYSGNSKDKNRYDGNLNLDMVPNSDYAHPNLKEQKLNIKELAFLAKVYMNPSNPLNSLKSTFKKLESISDYSNFKKELENIKVNKNKIKISDFKDIKGKEISPLKNFNSLKEFNLFFNKNSKKTEDGIKKYNLPNGGYISKVKIQGENYYKIGYSPNTFRSFQENDESFKDTFLKNVNKAIDKSNSQVQKKYINSLNELKWNEGGNGQSFAILSNGDTIYKTKENKYILSWDKDESNELPSSVDKEDAISLINVYLNKKQN